MNHYLLLFYLMGGGGFLAAVYLSKKEAELKAKLRAARTGAKTTVMHWFYGDSSTSEGQEKRRQWEMKLKYSGFSELHVRLASLILAVVFFSLYLSFSLNLLVAIAYAFFGLQIPYLIMEAVSAVQENAAVTQTASFISAFTDGLEMKLTVNAALSNAGKAVTGPPVGEDIRQTLHQIRMGSRERESLRALGERLGNHHLVNFGDVVGEVKRSGADDPAPFRLLEWVTNEEEKLQSEFLAEVMISVIFLAIIAVINLAALPMLKFSFHSTWVMLIGIKWLLFLLPAGALVLFWGIRSYATRRVML